MNGTTDQQNFVTFNLMYLAKIILRSLLPVMVIAFTTFITSCQKDIETITETVQPTDAFFLFTIPAGEQFATYNPYTPVQYDELKFVVKFDSSAVYKTIDPLNQWDVNKLFGFADNNAHHNQFSARFGWRWKDNELHLFSYIYNNGIRSDNDIGKIAIGKEHTCSIKVAGSSYLFTLNGVTSNWPRKSTTPKGEGYKLYPYFGGDELAPHTIHIWIKEL
jgi:hypothetical protein